jgi:hypothetical protein
VTFTPNGHLFTLLCFGETMRVQPESLADAFGGLALVDPDFVELNG